MPYAGAVEGTLSLGCDLLPLSLWRRVWLPRVVCYRRPSTGGNYINDGERDYKQSQSGEGDLLTVLQCLSRAIEKSSKSRERCEQYI
jgi:hypothetical protein